MPLKRGISLPKIIITVSHRIDTDSKTVDCPIYLPLRSGAAFDTRCESCIPGDDTGDNISEKNRAYSEFTAEYWAWKNVDADYYGMCHYRRYFSFADKHYRTPKHDKMIHDALLDQKSISRYRLDDTERISAALSEHDAVIPTPIDVRELPTKKGIKNTLHEMWDAYTDFYLGELPFSSAVLEIIKDVTPDYAENTEAYLNGTLHRSFNCFIMKKERYFELCEFTFKVMGEFEKRADALGVPLPLRFVGYVGELLNGIFIHRMLTVYGDNCLEKQLVFFHDTKIYRKTPRFLRLKFRISRIFGAIISFFFPRGSKRRARLKKLLKI